MSARDIFQHYIEADNENDLQRFLEENTQFIPREHLLNHGVSHSAIISKLRLADDFATDFAYMGGSSDTWRIVLVELERPSAKYFKDGTNDYHSDYERGVHQIASWKAWIEEVTNAERLKNVLRPLMGTHLHRRIEFKYVLVTGRHSMLDSDVRVKRRGALAGEDVRVLTWDSLLNKEHPRLVVLRRREQFLDVTSRSVDEHSQTEFFDHSLKGVVRLNADFRASAQLQQSKFTNHKTVYKGRLVTCMEAALDALEDVP